MNTQPGGIDSTHHNSQHYMPVTIKKN